MYDVYTSDSNPLWIYFIGEIIWNEDLLFHLKLNEKLSSCAWVHDKWGGVCMSESSGGHRTALWGPFSPLPFPVSQGMNSCHVVPQAPLLPHHLNSPEPRLTSLPKKLIFPKLHIVTVAQFLLSALNTFAENQLSTDKSVSGHCTFSHGSVCLCSRTMLSWELQFLVYTF